MTERAVDAGAGTARGTVRRSATEPAAGTGGNGADQLLRPPLTKRLRTGHWVAIDAVLSVLFATVSIAIQCPGRSRLVSGGRDTGWAAAVPPVPAAGSVALRRAAPLAAALTARSVTPRR